jgi:hypothetical protein
VADTYSVADGFPATDTGFHYHDTADNDSAVGADHANSGHVASNGYLWAAVMRSNTLIVTRSTDGGSSWATPVTLASGLSAAVGQTAIVEWSHEGSTYIGVFGVEDGVGEGKYFFRIEHDATDISAGNWTDESAAIPNYGDSDDHLSSVVFQNDIYLVTKTEEQPGGGEDLIVLLKRTAVGTWSSHVVWLSEETSSDQESRPKLSIDTTNEDIYIISNTEGGFSTIKYKKANLSDLDALLSSDPVTIISETNKRMRSTSAPRLVTGNTDLLVLVNNTTDETIWFSLVGVKLAESSQLSVAATINDWLSFDVEPNTLNLGDLVDTGGGTNIGTATTTLTVGTNNETGWFVDIRSENAALVHSSGTSTGQILSATTTVSAGEDHYGVQCASGDAVCSTAYNLSNNDVKGLVDTDELFASTGAPGSLQEVTLTIKAASTITNTPGTYSDTITLTALPGT